MAGQSAFSWKGMNKQGARVQGVIKANDLKEAQFELKKLDIEIISLKEKSQIIFSSKKKVKSREILLFARFLSTMLSAGLPILQALDVIKRDQDNPTMQSMLATIKTNVSSGKTLSESFGQFPEHFNRLFCNLIKSGETSGTLDKILKRIVLYLEKTAAIKQKIKKALVYPIAIVTVAMIVSAILLMFVVPQFAAMFKSFGAPLPIFTQAVINLSNFLRSYWWIILFGSIGGIIALRKWIKKSKEAQAWIDRSSLKIWVIGTILKKGIIARYTRTMAITLEAGMPLVEAMKSMADIMGNEVYIQAVHKISSDVMNGQQLNIAMSNTGLFPNMVIQMIAIGETSGTLSDMMNKVADYYEDDVNQVVDNLSNLLEPLIMLLLGIIIGSFVIAMYLPIFKIGALF